MFPLKLNQPKEMEKVTNNNSFKPHALCVPLPLQSHMKAMLKLAKLLHLRGFHVTFVNSEETRDRLLRSGGPRSLDGLPGFRFEAFPEIDAGSLEDVASPCRDSVCRLVEKIDGSGGPPVTCIVSDGFLPYHVAAGEDLGIPVALFFTIGVCAFIPFVHYEGIKEKFPLPLEDIEGNKRNGLLETVIDSIPGLKPIRLRDLPSHILTSDPNKEYQLYFSLQAAKHSPKASAVVFHTFEALEPKALASLEPTFPQVLPIGPIQLLLDRHVASIPQEQRGPLESIDCSLWSEEAECLRWLGSNDPGSVVYVNFGSLTVITPQELVEFGWGLANSHHPFLWAIRPDLVAGESALLPPKFAEEVRGRSFLTSWCPQEEVLAHRSVGAFLTHCGWNSTLESLSSGVPMMCWPFSGDQMTNNWYLCGELGIGVEMDRDVERGKVERVVREVMEGEKGKEMKEKALEWKRKVEEAVGENGSSSLALDKLVGEVLMSKQHISHDVSESEP